LGGGEKTGRKVGNRQSGGKKEKKGESEKKLMFARFAMKNGWSRPPKGGGKKGRKNTQAGNKKKKKEVSPKVLPSNPTNGRGGAADPLVHCWKIRGRKRKLSRDKQREGGKRSGKETARLEGKGWRSEYLQEKGIREGKSAQANRGGGKGRQAHDLVIEGQGVGARLL